MIIRSLRSRVLLASFLWTGGLLTLLTMFMTHLFETHGFRHWIQVHRFFQAPVVIAIAAFCMVMGLLQARKSLSSITRLRGRVTSLHTGSDRRVEGSYPSEVQPLVNDLNALLDHRERAVERALAKAGDLAHGLKTPLAILAHEAHRARTAGQSDLAHAIEQQVERMRRQVDYHLAHARAVASGVTGAPPAPVKDSADGLARALHRLHAERGLAIDVDVPPEATTRVQREDLDEMLGNLLDNGCKWARTRVRVSVIAPGQEAPRSAGQPGASIEIAIDDDGPGIAPDMRDKVLQRGVRADQAAPGSGLGLAIVRDLAELYGGTVVLDESAMGGTRARLTLPA